MSADPAVDRPAGTLLAGRYRLGRLIGRGSSAHVYRADDQKLGRAVAVKVAHGALADDQRFRRRFESEARLAASLNHPRVLAVYDWSDDGAVHLVTELLGGGSLRDLLDRGVELSPSQVVLVGLQAGAGLAHAHARGIVHRDVKPANLMFTAEGDLRIADFGIGRAVAEASWTEPDGVLVGTARYAAPEQARGDDVDGRADVYSLGLTLLEALTGAVPLVGPTPLATMVLRQDADVVVSDDLGDLGMVLALATRRDPERRPTAAEFVTALKQVAAGLPRPDALPVEVADHADDVDLDGVDGSAVMGPSAVIDLRDRAEVAAPTVVDPTDPMPRPTAGAQQEDGVVDEVPSRRRSVLGILAVGIAVVLLGIGLATAGRGAVDAIVDDPPPEPVTYPVGTYVGRSLAVVAAEVERNVWELEITRTRADGSEVDEVLTQTPDPGTQLEEGSTVVVVVSDGPELRSVPAIVGVTLADAEQALLDSGLDVGQVAQAFDEDVPDGIVMEVEADEGATFETGTAIDLVVSAGPEPRIVPDLSGRTLAEATAALEAIGLVALPAEDFSTQVAEGLVIANEPAAESSVPRGTEITVTVSLGLPFVEVPDVRGLSAASAADELAEAGLVVVDTVGPPNRNVLATDPSPGESVRMGTEIVVFTGRG